MKPEPHLVVGDSFADGVGASAAGDFALAPSRTGVQCASPCGWAADGPAALLAPVPKVALFLLSAAKARANADAAQQQTKETMWVVSVIAVVVVFAVGAAVWVEVFR